MSLVNQNTLRDIKEMRSSAISASSYESGYNRAMRGLERAIAQLEQLQHTTQNLEVKVVEKG